MISGKKYSAPVLGVILAGGRARRMAGGDKILLKVGDQRIIDHICERLGPQVDELILNVNNPALRAETNLEILSDAVPMGKAIGPMGGVYSALNYAKKNGFRKMAASVY